MDSIKRFSTKAKNYHKYRPRYPEKIIELLKTDTNLLSKYSYKIADIGSGTGILSELFLKNHNTVFGVEPNDKMREVAEKVLKNYLNFISIKGTAERTNLKETVNMITAGQSFHWFDMDKAYKEFKRILKPNGYVVLIWNQRRNLTTPLGRDIEEILDEYGTDYIEVKNHEENLDFNRFFGNRGYSKRILHNKRIMSYDELQGRLVSISCVPNIGNPKYSGMIAKLKKVFNQYQVNGRVTTEYDTEVFIGQL
ncbi:MAG: class I SAM-dependent methyltransferase [Candidatus Hodarchaeota archaeon]